MDFGMVIDLAKKMTKMSNPSIEKHRKEWDRKFDRKFGYLEVGGGFGKANLTSDDFHSHIRAREDALLKRIKEEFGEVFDREFNAIFVHLKEKCEFDDNFWNAKIAPHFRNIFLHWDKGRAKTKRHSEL